MFSSNIESGEFSWKLENGQNTTKEEIERAQAG